MPLRRPFRGDPPVAARAFEYRAGEHVPPHVHGRHQLVCAASGVMTVHTPRGTWVVPPQRGVWIPARTRHSIDASGAVSMRTLYVRTDTARRWPDGCRVIDVSPLLREIVLEAVRRGGLDDAVRADRHLLEVLIDHLAALSAAPLHLPEPRDERARRLTALLRAAPAEPRNLAAAARRSGASRRTLERLFRREVGMSPGRWRRQLRLAEGLRLLAAGASVTAVALDVGYESPSAFVAAFRQAFGTTPGQYFRSTSEGGAPSAAVAVARQGARAARAHRRRR